MTSTLLANQFGYLTQNEVDAIHQLGKLITSQDPIFVNVGAGAGTSSLAMREARPDAVIFTVDISEGGPLGGLSNEINAYDDRKLKYPKQILGDSRDIATRWTGEFCEFTIDFIFIDDGHQYDDVLGDVTGWYPNMTPGGIMAFHDYGSNDWPAVKEVVDRIFLSKKDPILHVDTTIAFYV